jgi:Virulence factor membrane-bound polymerase, C-terminal/O-Antigen ligase
MRAVLLALLGLSWIIPDHFPPWWMFHTEFPTFATSALCLISCISWKKKELEIPTALVWLGFLIITVILQRLLGVIHFVGDAWVVIAYVILFASAWIWSYRWSKEVSPAEVLKAMSFFFVAIGLITTFQLLAQWLRMEEVFDGWVLYGLPNGRPRANIGQPNLAATTLMMAIVAVALLHTRKIISAPTAWMLGVLFVMGTVLTESRTALLSGAILSVGLLYFAARQRDRWRAILPMLLLLAVQQIAALIFRSATTVNTQETLTSISLSAVVAGGDPRWLLWQQMIAAVMERPLSGWGWLQIPEAQQWGAAMFPGNVRINYAHNIFLDSLVMLGIPVTLIFILGPAAGLKSRISKVNVPTNAMFAFVLMLPFWVHSMLELPHAYAYMIFPIGILCGVADYSTVNKKQFQIKNVYYFTFVTLWVTCLLMMGKEYLQIEEAHRRGRFDSRGIGQTPVEKQLPVMFFTQLSELDRVGRVIVAPDMSSEDVQSLLTVSKRYTASTLELRAALALALNNRPDDAIERMHVIKNLFESEKYTNAKNEYLTLQESKYPILSSIKLP